MLGFILGTKSYASSINSNESIEETPYELKIRLCNELATIDVALSALSYKKFSDVDEVSFYILDNVDSLKRIMTEFEGIKNEFPKSFKYNSLYIKDLIRGFNHIKVKNYHLYVMSETKIKAIKESSKSKKVKTIWKPW